MSLFRKRPSTRLVVHCECGTKLEIIDRRLVVFQPGEPPCEMTQDEQLIPWTPAPLQTARAVKE